MPSSKSSRSPASIFSRIGAIVSSASRTANDLPLSVDDGVRQRLELIAMELAVQARAGTPSVVECNFARTLQRAARFNPHERPVERAAGECVTDDRILLRREQERQRRRPVTQIGAGDLASLDRRTRAVEDVVGDLEGDAEREPVRSGAAAEAARRLEQLS